MKKKYFFLYKGFKFFFQTKVKAKYEKLSLHFFSTLQNIFPTTKKRNIILKRKNTRGRNLNLGKNEE